MNPEMRPRQEEEKQPTVVALDLVKLSKEEPKTEHSESRGMGAAVTAEHTTVKLPPEFAAKNRNLELPIEGKVNNEKTGVSEEYKMDYVKLPDGSVVKSRVESKFSDGTETTMQRMFDDQGRESSQVEYVNGKLTQKYQFKYNEAGKLDAVGYGRYEYDAEGKAKAVQLHTQTIENGSVIVRTKDSQGNISRQNYGNQSKLGGNLTSSKSILENVSGRTL